MGSKFVYEEGDLMRVRLPHEVAYDDSLTVEERRKELDDLYRWGGAHTQTQISGYMEMLAMQEMAEEGTLDDAFEHAACAAAAIVPTAPSGWPLERELEKALLQPLQETLKGCTVGGPRKLDTPSWDPQPRGVDLVVFKGEKAWAAAELKIASVEQTLWDLFKLLAVEPPLRAGYLVVAASERKWASSDAYVVLFGSSDAKQWQSQELLDQWPKAWQDLLAGGPARPRKVPAVVKTSLIAAEPMQLVRNYQLRVLRVQPASDSLIEVPGD